MKMPSSTPSSSGVSPIANGLIQPQLGWIEWVAPFPVYTLSSAAAANAARIVISAPSRNCCTRADSSIPRQQIHVISAIHTVEPIRSAVVFVGPASQPTSENEYALAITASEAITITSATKIAQPLIQPTYGPSAR